MSLPSFPDRNNIPSRDEVVNQIIASIAMEELGLSHIINAEGEKLQYALGTIPGISGPDGPLTMDQLLELNESVRKTLDSTMMNQFFLKEKLFSALSSSVMQGPTGPQGPQGPATIAVDPSVDNLEPGQLPYVNNDQGTDQNVILKFGIPRGVTGATGATGAAGTLEPETELFTVKNEDDSETVTYGGELTFKSNSLNISVETGPAVSIEKPYGIGTIIPFASGEAHSVTTLTGSGERNVITMLGFGTAQEHTAPDNPINLNSITEKQLAFSMPAAGTITSIAAYFSVTAGGYSGYTIDITAQVFQSTGPDNAFYPVPDASILVASVENVPSVGTVYHNIKSDLNIPVTAETRLLFVFSSTSNQTTLLTSITGYMSGSIEIR